MKAYRRRWGIAFPIATPPLNTFLTEPCKVKVDEIAICWEDLLEKLPNALRDSYNKDAVYISRRTYHGEEPIRLIKLKPLVLPKLPISESNKSHLDPSGRRDFGIKKNERRRR